MTNGASGLSGEKWLPMRMKDSKHSISWSSVTMRRCPRVNPASFLYETVCRNSRKNVSPSVMAVSAATMACPLRKRSAYSSVSVPPRPALMTMPNSRVRRRPTISSLPNASESGGMNCTCNTPLRSEAMAFCSAAPSNPDSSWGAGRVAFDPFGVAFRSLRRAYGRTAIAPIRVFGTMRQPARLPFCG